MGYHLERTNHEPTKLCQQQSSFRTNVETIALPTEQDDPITMKFPTSTLHHARRPKGLFKSPFPEEEAQEPSPIMQEQQGRFLSWQQFEQAHQHKEKPVEATNVDERPTLKMPAAIPARRKQFVELPDVPRRALQEGELHESQRRNSFAPLVEQEPIDQLETLLLRSVFGPTQDLNDAAEFEKLSTVPMMVFPEIAI